MQKFRSMKIRQEVLGFRLFRIRHDTTLFVFNRYLGDIKDNTRNPRSIALRYTFSYYRVKRGAYFIEHSRHRNGALTFGGKIANKVMNNASF